MRAPVVGPVPVGAVAVVAFAVTIACTSCAPQATSCDEGGAAADRETAWIAVVDANTLEGEDTVLVRRERLTADDLASFAVTLRGLPDAPSDATIDALLAANPRAASFNDDDVGGAGASVRFVAAADVPSSDTRDSEAWTDFAAAFGAAEVLELSAPGFTCDEGAVYVVHDCGALCSRGVVFVLARGGDGAWVVDREVRLWIS